MEAQKSRHDFRKRVKARDPMLGAFCPAPSPELIEVAAFAGFDFTVIDAEHGPITISDIVHMVRAGHGAGIAVMVRVPEATTDFVLRSLDAGADGIIVPQIETAEQAAAAVARMHYPPNGNRGLAFYTRAHRFMKDTGPAAMRAADERVVTGALIETPLGVDNAEAIAATPGIDLMLMGPSDLAANIGFGPDTERKVEEAVTKVSQAGIRHGVSTSIAAQSTDAAVAYAQRGYSIVVTGLLPPLLRVSTEFVNKSRTGIADLRTRA